MGQQVGQDHVVGGLLGEEEDDIVNALHLLGGDGFDGDREVYRAHNMGALFVERLHVGLVTVDHLHIAAVLCHVGSQHRTHGAAAQDCNFHKKPSFCDCALILSKRDANLSITYPVTRREPSAILTL